MVEQDAEQFARQAFDLGLVDERDLQGVWAHFGTHNVPRDEFKDHLLRRSLLTNYQIDRMEAGEAGGYFYGDYKVLYFVGNGSFARVYRAVHRNTGQVVALKVLRKRYSEDPLELQRFLREGQVGTTLRHPNVVPIYEVHSERKIHFLVMEFVEGQSLRDFVRIRKQVDPLEATKIMSGIIAGLVYASEKGVTHRDLKLSNVLISSDGNPKIVDFGLAAVSNEGRGESYSNTRTIDYAALEKLTGVGKDDPRSDIFFAGCMYYHMLAGVPALSEDRQQRKSMDRFRRIKPIRDVFPDIPRIVEQAVMKSIELDADKRYAKPVNMLVDLNKVMKTLESTTEEATEDARLEGESKTVLLIESNTKVQDAFRESLKKRGYRVLVIGDPVRGWERIQADPTRIDCVIVSTAAIGQEALELFQKLGREKEVTIPSILLLGKNQAGSLDRLSLSDQQRAVAMPLKMTELRKALTELVSAAAAHRS